MFLDNKLFRDIAVQLDEMLSDVDIYKEIYKIERDKAEKEIMDYATFKERAILGDEYSRKYIINQFTVLMCSGVVNIDENKLKKMIDFDDLRRNSPQVLFEMLLSIYDFSELINKYELMIKVSECDIKNITVLEETALKHTYSDINTRLQLVATIAYTREYGQDCIDTLQHHNLNEIGVIDKDYIYIVFRGNKLWLEFLKFDDSNIILNIQKKTTQNSPVNYDTLNPTLVASKHNSSRITVAGYDITPNQGDFYYNERIFNLKKITLEQMRDTYKTIDNLIFEFLNINQRGRGSHFVTGSDMGVGKSTFLLAMMEKVPDNWGIGILDTQNELQARRKFPWKNIKTLIQTPKRSISDCFIIELKMARDILYIGEITKPEEVAELINASLRLNAGVGATMHSLSPFEVVTNIRNLLMRTDMYNNAEIAEFDIVKGLNLVIHMAHHPTDTNRIIIESISEVQLLDREKYIEPFQTGDTKSKIASLLDMALLALNKYLYPKCYKYNVIFKFDSCTDSWMPCNLPGEGYFEHISRYVSKNDIDAFKDNFRYAKTSYNKRSIANV